MRGWLRIGNGSWTLSEQADGNVVAFRSIEGRREESVHKNTFAVIAP